MHTKKAILVRIILRRGSFFRFLKRLKESRNMKKTDKIFILSVFPQALGANKLVFLIFPDIITQSTAIVKTKIEIFIKKY